VGAGDALEGVHWVRHEPLSAILMDLMLPGCSGEHAAGAIRNDLRYGDIPLILVSGHPDLPRIAEATGASGYLRKPFRPAELVQRVRRAIEESGRSA
jgi:CheY-like chemotaxis protein